MLPSKKIAILSFITVFIVGMAVGVVLENQIIDKQRREHRRSGGNRNDFLFEKFTRELALTPVQQDSLRGLLDDIKEKHKKLNDDRFVAFERIRQEFDDEFRKILTDEQLARYNEMVHEFEQERRRHPKPEENKQQ